MLKYPHDRRTIVVASEISARRRATDFARIKFVLDYQNDLGTGNRGEREKRAHDHA